jgi:hypothetical protein
MKRGVEREEGEKERGDTVAMTGSPKVKKCFENKANMQRRRTATKNKQKLEFRFIHPQPATALNK